MLLRTDTNTTNQDTNDRAPRQPWVRQASALGNITNRATSSVIRSDIGGDLVGTAKSTMDAAKEAANADLKRDVATFRCKPQSHPLLKDLPYSLARGITENISVVLSYASSQISAIHQEPSALLDECSTSLLVRCSNGVKQLEHYGQNAKASGAEEELVQTIGQITKIGRLFTTPGNPKGAQQEQFDSLVGSIRRFAELKAA